VIAESRPIRRRRLKGEGREARWLRSRMVGRGLNR
jgi:hypothetical protein